MENKSGEIRRCLRCFKGCAYTLLFKGTGIDCAINPEAGKELGFETKTALSPKKVLVIGSGPSGMEAARALRLRGHHTILIEKSERLGGKLTSLSIPQFKEEYRWLLEWYIQQLNSLGVIICLNQEVSVNSVKRINPDLIIVATGADPINLKIPGIEKAFPVDNFLSNHIVVGPHVAIIGGGMTGCETALYAAQKAKSVNIIEQLNGIAMDTDPVINRPALIQALTDRGVHLYLNCKATKITNKEVECFDSAKKQQNIKADSVLVAVGYKAKKELFDELKVHFNEVYCIGDCDSPSDVKNAIHQGFQIAQQIV
jgi:2-enoate reductase